MITNRSPIVSLNSDPAGTLAVGASLDTPDVFAGTNLFPKLGSYLL